MKLKYYLRGLGIGIAVTAFVMGISIGNHNELTDEEIIKYAEDLGMVKENEVLLPSNMTEEKGVLNEEQEEQSVSADIVPPQPAKTVVASSNEVEKQDVEKSVSQLEIDETLSEKEDADNASNIDSTEDDVINDNEGTDIIEIQVESGNGSDAVSRKLADAGLIASASAYDKFLCDNNYDNRIKVGKHTIPVGSSDEEIAGIITSAAE